MIPIIYDQPEDNGIVVSFDFENGTAFNIFISDDDAEDMIAIIQNKLNNRI